jgi:hypothetical protein
MKLVENERKLLLNKKNYVFVCIFLKRVDVVNKEQVKLHSADIQFQRVLVSFFLDNETNKNLKTTAIDQFVIDVFDASVLFFLFCFIRL